MSTDQQVEVPYASLVAGVKGSRRSWKGVIRDANGQEVWSCCHVHKNRDESSYAGGISARSCSRQVRQYLVLPTVAEATDEALRSGTFSSRLVEQHNYSKEQSAILRDKLNPENT